MRRTTRQSKPFKFFDDNPAYLTPTKPKNPRKKRVVERAAPEPRPADDPPAPEFQEAQDAKTSTYSPPIQVEFAPFQVRLTEREPIDLFLVFLGMASLRAIVDATNLHAFQLQIAQSIEDVLHPRQ